MTAPRTVEEELRSDIYRLQHENQQQAGQIASLIARIHDIESHLGLNQ